MVDTTDDKSEFEKTFKVYIKPLKSTSQPQRLERLYTMDYRGTRVSFHLQQARGLALAHLIDEETELWKKPDTDTNVNIDKKKVSIAIVGGGFGGVTCFTALHALGYSDTHLFEAGSELLNAQAKSAHRYAHPSYNDWPMMDSFSATTQLPFLNWYGGKAEEVVKQVRKDRAYLRIMQNQKNQVFLGKPIDFATFDNKQWTLTTQKGYPIPKTNFDIVVYAAGFGQEGDLSASASKSYWWADHLSNYCTERHLFPGYKKYISGFGDGGLIDAIRIGFGGIDDGNRAVRLISMLRHERYRTIPIRLEDSSALEHSAFETKLRNLLNTQATMPGFQERVEVEIKSLLKATPPYGSTVWDETRVFLSELFKIRSDASESLVLVGRDQHFRPPAKASPINVLLFSLLQAQFDQDCELIKNHSISYAWGEFFLGGKDNTSKKVARANDVVPSKIQFYKQDGGERRNAEAIEIPSRDNVLVLRHGPSEKAFRRFIGVELGAANDGMEPVRLGHGLNMNPLQRMATKNEGLFAKLFELEPGSDSANREYAKYKLDLVSKLVVDTLGVGEVSLQPDTKANVSHIEIALPFGVSIRSKFAELGGIDRQMFGVPVVYRPTDANPLDQERELPTAFHGSALPKRLANDR